MFGWFRPKFPALKEKAEKAFAEKQYAEAIRLFQEAAEKADKEPESVKEEVQKKIIESRDLLAKERLSEAKKLWKSKLAEEAAELAEIARDRAHDPALKKEAETLLADIDKSFASHEADEDDEESHEQTEEDRYELIMAGAPEEFQEGYQSLGAGFQKAVLEAHEGSPKKALGLLKPFLDKHDAAKYEYALCLAATKELDKAIEALEPLSKKTNEIAAKLGALYSDRAMTKGAKPATRLTPREHQKPKPEATPDKAKEDLQKAESHLMDAIENDSGRAELYVFLGEVLLIQGEASKAKRLLDAGLRRVSAGSRQASLWNMIGKAEAIEGKFAEAESALEKSIKLSWGLDRDEDIVQFNTAAAWLLVQILLDQKKNLERAEELLRALQMKASKEDKPVFLFEEGRAKLLLGKTKEGKEQMEKAISLFKKHPREKEYRELLDEIRASNP